MKTKESIAAYNKEYFSRPEVIARAKMRNAIPEARAVRRAYKKTPAGIAANRRSRVKQKEKYYPVWRAKHLEKRYGMTSLDFDAMFEKQGGACAICLKPSKYRLHVDHCHESNKVRGLLCGSCNRGLGMFKDNIDFMSSAIKYLCRS